MNMLPTIMVTWLACNALLFACLAFGRYVRWSDLLKYREARRLR